MAEVKNYKLGQDGVDVDSASLLDSESSLTKAQNAIIDSLGVGGGLKKRPGLTKHNSGALAGSALGGISVPLASFVDTRSLYLAQQDGAAVKSWYSSVDLFASSGVLDSNVGVWQSPATYYSDGAGICRMGVFANGKLFYASSAYTSGTTSPIIRAYNGTEDREFSKILPATTLGITGMFVVKGVVYVLTLDSGTTDANFIGRVFTMDTVSGKLAQLGNAITTGHVPISLAVYNSRVFVGTGRVTTTDEAVIVSINPIDETSWTTDLSASADDYAITSIASFKGLLYATTKNGGAATKGKILQRSLAGVWSTVDSTTNNSGTYDGSAVFGGALYVSSRSYATTTTTAVVRKSTDGSSWSTVASGSATAGFGLMTVIGLRLFSQFGTKLQHTTDGASWTLATPGAGGNVDGALGVLMAGGAAAYNDPTTTPSGKGDNQSQTGVTTTVTTTTTGVTLAQLQAVLGASMFQSASITLTDAQFRALGNNGAPQVVVPAPGTNKIIIVWRMAVSANGLTTMNIDASLRAQYQGSTTNILTSTFSLSLNALTGRLYGYASGIVAVGGVSDASTDAAENSAVEISSSSGSAPTGGSTSSGVYVTCWYSILTLGTP